MTLPTWLPAMNPYPGDDWLTYQAALYAIFRRDFVQSFPTFDGAPVRIKRYPPIDGLESGFWHLISENRADAYTGEMNRVPDLGRCARLEWVRKVIESTPPAVRRWRNTRGTARRAVIALPDFSYAVILDVRNGFFVLWTAYCVDGPHRREKLRKECEANGG